MPLPIIVEGDLTTTGGRLIPSQIARKSNGKNIIVLGDKFFCPLCKTMGSAVEASNLQFCNSIGVVYHGCKVQCSCAGNHFVMSKQSVDLTDIKSNSKVLKQNIEDKKIYEHQFVLVDEFTNTPLANRYYKMTMGEVIITGKTNNQGETQLMTASEMLEVMIEIYPENYQEQSK